MSLRVTAAMLATASVLALAPAAQAANAGLPDPTFGTAGFTKLDEPVAPNELLQDLVIQADGRILGAGARNGAEGFLLARFNPDGSPDLTFGTGGISVEPDTNVIGAPRVIDEIEARPDGKIVAVGLGRAATNAFQFARYQPGGALDPTFGEGGMRQVVIAPYGSGHALDLAPDGKVVGAGESQNAAIVVRLTENGEPDASFNAVPAGVRTIDVPGGLGEDASAAQVLGDGTILIGGTSSAGAFLAELEEGGTPVAGFGIAGITVRDLGTGPSPSGRINDLEVLPDGRIVATGRAGTPNSGSDSLLFVARFTADGEFDPTFGTGGVFRSDPTNATDEGRALAVQPDGKIVVAGGQGRGSSPGAGDTWILRLTVDGQLDPEFGANGQTVAKADPETDEARGLALQTDGRPVIAGLAGSTSRQLLVGRFTLAEAPPLDPIRALAPPTGRCDGKRATLVGTARADRLVGTSGRDVIVSLGGRDRIASKGGNDLICAGAGNDVLRGGGGRDRLLGGAGKDRILGGPGRDLCIGGAGKDSAGASCERLKRVP